MNPIFDFFSNLSVTSSSFFAFVLIALGAYYLVPKKAQNLILLLSSYLFSISWNWTFAVVILTASGSTFLLAVQIEKTEKRSRSRWLWLGIALNLAALLFFKYFGDTQGLLIRAINHFKIAAPALVSLKLLTPIGISFYVLQSISYLVDVHREQIPASRSFVDVSLYLAYFPKLLAGPIERADNFFKQIHADRIIDNALLTDSLVRIFVGLVRKIVISDMIARLIPVGVFATPKNFPIPDLIFWWIVFAFVVYNDFAGYTSIARGVSGLFGIQLSPNFEQPFFSTSYIDFWNRWHISLSNWLRDYIYLPVSRAMLRRNPSGRYWPNLVVPPLVTMIVSGLWHGLNPHFLLWGFLNGLLQGVERLQKMGRKPSSAAPPKWRQYLGDAATLLVLLLISVPFKLDLAQSLDFWTGLFRWSAAHTLAWNTVLRPTLGIGSSLLIDFLYLPEKDEKGLLHLSRRTQITLLTAGLFLLFLATRQQPPAPFIYQEF